MVWLAAMSGDCALACMWSLSMASWAPMGKMYSYQFIVTIIVGDKTIYISNYDLTSTKWFMILYTAKKDSFFNMKKLCAYFDILNFLQTRQLLKNECLSHANFTKDAPEALPLHWPRSCLELVYVEHGEYQLQKQCFKISEVLYICNRCLHSQNVILLCVRFNCH